MRRARRASSGCNAHGRLGVDGGQRGADAWRILDRVADTREEGVSRGSGGMFATAAAILSGARVDEVLGVRLSTTTRPMWKSLDEMVCAVWSWRECHCCALLWMCDTKVLECGLMFVGRYATSGDLLVTPLQTSLSMVARSKRAILNDDIPVFDRSRCQHNRSWSAPTRGLVETRAFASSVLLPRQPTCLLFSNGALVMLRRTHFYSRGRLER